MRIFVLYDSCEGKLDNLIILKDVINVFSPPSKKKIVSWFLGGVIALARSRKNDIIICWYDFQAIICYWLCVFLLKKRKVVCINILLKDKDTLKNKLVAWLYRIALNSDNMIASVTSVEYGQHVANRLRLNKSFNLVHDIYREDYEIKNHVPINIKKNSVFCGGRNGRDWTFMLDVAKRMPDVLFNFVMPSNYSNVIKSYPGNIKVLFDIPKSEFLETLCSAEIVALPLDTEAPAGLIVMFQAAANMKYIITTDTMTTREYVNDSRGCLLPNDTDKWVSEISRALDFPDECYTKANNMKNFLRQYCNEQLFADGINSMVTNLLNGKNNKECNYNM